MTVTMKDLKTISDDLKTLKPASLTGDSDQPLSNRQVVMKLAPRLLAKRRQGCASNDLVEFLKKHGLNIKGRDLNRYLKDYQESKAPTPKAALPTTPKEPPPGQSESAPAPSARPAIGGAGNGLWGILEQ